MSTLTVGDAREMLGFLRILDAWQAAGYRYWVGWNGALGVCRLTRHAGMVDAETIQTTGVDMATAIAEAARIAEVWA